MNVETPVVMLGEFVIFLVLSHHNKNLKWWTDQCYSPVKFPWVDQCYLSVLQFSFMRKNKGSTPLRSEGRPTQKTERREAPGSILTPLFMFFLLPLSLPYVNWASQEGCLFYLRSSLQSSDLLLFYSCGLFSSLCFSHHHSGLLFPILTT